MKIYFFYYPVEWTTDSLGLALKNIAEENGGEYIPVHYRPGEWFIDRVEPTKDPVLVFFIYESKRQKEDFDNLFMKCPNAKTIQVACDSQDDYGKTGYAIQPYVSLHLDLIEEYVERIRHQSFPAELLWWTISKNLYNYITGINNIVDKDNDFICLCKPTFERLVFFNSIKRKDRSILSFLDCYNTEEFINIYMRSRFTLGITHSSHSGHPVRSIKAFRDWIGPLCNSVLVYDDHPQMVKYFSDIIPFYKYNDVDSLLRTIDTIDPNIILAQQEWISKNLLETQLTSIFERYGLK